MDISEAYYEVMNAIQQMKDINGIEVEIVALDSSNNEEYETRLPSKLWKHITFHPTTESQREIIHQNLTDLSALGILFDTGYGCGCVDWEIDFSLRIEEEQSEIEDSVSAKEHIKNVAIEQFPLPNTH